METKEQRVKILENYIKIEKLEICLDKTPKSLVPLWEWFQEQIEWEDRTEEEINQRLQGKADWMKPIISSHTKKMSVLILYLGYDISVYFGETFITNHPSIYWG